MVQFVNKTDLYCLGLSVSKRRKLSLVLKVKNAVLESHVLSLMLINLISVKKMLNFHSKNYVTLTS